MEISDFKMEIEEALSSNKTVSFFCSCSVEYSGRAESFLSKGDRLIIIKSDNTLLVHQSCNSNAVNYMKSGSSFDLIKEADDGMILKARNLALKEYMNIEIYKIYDFISRKLEDGRSLELVGTEADMSDMIKDKPVLISEDFKPLSREEHTKFGFIDVFGHDGNGGIIVVECKRYSAGLDAVQQLRRYVEKIKDLKGIDDVKGILASPSITPNAENMLKKWDFRWVMVSPPKRLERYNRNQRSIGDFN